MSAMCSIFWMQCAHCALNCTMCFNVGCFKYVQFDLECSELLSHVPAWSQWTADENCYFRNWTSLFTPSAKEHPNPFLLSLSLTLTTALLVDNVILSSLGSILVRDLKIKCIFLAITQKTNKAVSLLQITFSCFITSNVLSAGHIMSLFPALLLHFDSYPGPRAPIVRGSVAH